MVDTIHILPSTVGGVHRTHTALTKTAFHKVIRLIEAITEAAKEGAREGEIGPSRVGALRNWYDDSHAEDEDGAFFKHVGLPRDCSWEAYRRHYTTRKRIDHARLGDDLVSFPPIAARLKELQELAA
jgi:hypothetical protein